MIFWAIWLAARGTRSGGGDDTFTGRDLILTYVIGIPVGLAIGLAVGLALHVLFGIGASLW